MDEIEKLYNYFLESTGVCIDSRKVIKGVIFFALKGNNSDGNEFAKQAIIDGASLAVIDDKRYQGPNTFLVDNVLTTLQYLAKYHREKLGIPIIGMTGSNGKTTTKELIKAVLSKKFNVSATEGNYNNHIGVPLTLLSIGNEAEIAIIEMGANHVGEIKFLCELAQPTHGMITNIGRAHLEGFGSVEGIIKGKGELYNFLIATKGVVFVNAQNETLMKLLKGVGNVVRYLSEDSLIKQLSSESTLKIQDKEGNVVETQLVGEYNFYNIAAAMCIGDFFGVNNEAINNAISEYLPENNRSQIIHKSNNTIILDAYNANPSSMLAALGSFSTKKAYPKIVILGDMFELGEYSAVEHRSIVEKVLELKLKMALFCGKEFKKVEINQDGMLFFETKSELEYFLKKEKLDNVYCLVKGSRGMSLETIIEYL